MDKKMKKGVLSEAVGSSEMIKKCEPLVKDKYDYKDKKMDY